MLSQLLPFFRDAGEWQRARDTAWAPAIVPGEDGRTPFLIACESALEVALVEAGQELRGRTAELALAGDARPGIFSFFGCGAAARA